MIPFRRLGQLVLIVTSFTVAHSITLIASAFELGPTALWFPPLIETLIAMSIVYMALENIVLVGSRSQPQSNVHRRWMITFAFGLVHGFGFSFALRETLQFAGSHLLTSLLVVQPRRRARSVARARSDGPAPRRAVPVRERTDRRDHSLRADRAHRVALDDRARRTACARTNGRRSTRPFSRPRFAGRCSWSGSAAVVWLVRGVLERRKGQEQPESPRS